MSALPVPPAQVYTCKNWQPSILPLSVLVILLVSWYSLLPPTVSNVRHCSSCPPVRTPSLLFTFCPRFQVKVGTFYERSLSPAFSMGSPGGMDVPLLFADAYTVQRRDSKWEVLTQSEVSGMLVHEPPRHLSNFRCVDRWTAFTCCPVI